MGAREARKGGTAKRIFGTMAAAGGRVYSRARDLAQLIALWPHELDDHSQAGTLRILAKLRRALRAERRRGLAGHWSYDLNRHLGLLSAYKGELARLRLEPLKAQPNCTRRARGLGCG
jgi:DNA-binding IclR family transcriptional regulator